MRRVAVIAGGMCRWGYRNATVRDMIAEAGKECFDSCEGLKPKDVDGLLFSTAFFEKNQFQTHSAPLAAEILGVQPTNLIGKVELLCGSGTTAIQLAYTHIASGYSDVVMVVGADKLYLPDKRETFFNIQAACDRDFDCIHGLGVPPPLFAMVAKKHMKEFGTTEEQMAMVAVKSHRNGAKNRFAQFQNEVTLDEVLEARPIVPPLKLFDCCPVTDGAAAVVLAAEERAKDFTKDPIYILGIAQTSTHKNSANMPGFTTWKHLTMSAKKAYERSGVTPDDVDVAEIHDCFTISEIVEYEDLGFCGKGEGGEFISEGLADFGGKVVVNPSGGLLSCGHPFGATGERQASELFHQLRGDASNQVDGATIALQHTMSGFCSDSSITIYGRNV
jgi:acetyl-CoA C-acetyltransferase